LNARCPECGYDVGGSGSYSTSNGEPIETRRRLLVRDFRSVFVTMCESRISRLRALCSAVDHNRWKRNTGCRSERVAADESDRELIPKLQGALEEALDEIVRLQSNSRYS